MNPPARTAPPAAALRIMLVEDDPDIRSVARLALEAIGGHTVLACNSGAAAVMQGPAFAPDLVLLDVMMPGLDGPATLRALRAEPALAGVPVVFMTARVQPEDLARFRALGVAGVIPKPFDPMRLAAEAEALASRRPARGAPPEP